MRLRPVVYGILVIAIYLGTIYAAQAAGWWSISGKVTASGEKVQPTGTNVGEIKGWMTIGDIAGAYKIPVEDIIRAFNLPSDTPPSRQVKELESATFSTTALRNWIQERMSKTPVP
jgi:hypothetical protein